MSQSYISLNFLKAKSTFSVFDGNDKIVSKFETIPRTTGLNANDFKILVREEDIHRMTTTLNKSSLIDITSLIPLAFPIGNFELTGLSVDFPKPEAKPNNSQKKSESIAHHQDYSQKEYNPMSNIDLSDLYLEHPTVNIKGTQYFIQEKILEDINEGFLDDMIN